MGVLKKISKSLLQRKVFYSKMFTETKVAFLVATFSPFVMGVLDETRFATNKSAVIQGLTGDMEFQFSHGEAVEGGDLNGLACNVLGILGEDDSWIVELAECDLIEVTQNNLLKIPDANLRNGAATPGANIGDETPNVPEYNDVPGQGASPRSRGSVHSIPVKIGSMRRLLDTPFNQLADVCDA